MDTVSSRSLMPTGAARAAWIAVLIALFCAAGLGLALARRSAPPPTPRAPFRYGNDYLSHIVRGDWVGAVAATTDAASAARCRAVIEPLIERDGPMTGYGSTSSGTVPAGRPEVVQAYQVQLGQHRVWLNVNLIRAADGGWRVHALEAMP
jgi:hypothetical protein